MRNILDNRYDWNIKEQINQIKGKASFLENPFEFLRRKLSLNGEVPGYSVYSNTSVYSLHHRSYLSVFIRSLIHGIQGLIVLLPQTMFTISLFLSVSNCSYTTSSRKFVIWICQYIGVHWVRFAYSKCKQCNVHSFIIMIWILYFRVENESSWMIVLRC